MLSGGSASDKGRSDSISKGKRKATAAQAGQDLGDEIEAANAEMARRDQEEQDKADEPLPEATRLTDTQVEEAAKRALLGMRQFSLNQRRRKNGRRITALNRGDYTGDAS